MAKLQFTFYAIGIFVSFFCYGIIHEKITKTQYTNPDGSVESFTYSTSLVTIYCIMNYFFSLIISSKVKQEDTTPTILYVITAFLYFLAMVCSNLALQFINYPTQVIAKSCKPITVMIFGVLLGRKSYSFKKYIFVGMVVVGVIMFLHKEKQDKKSDGDSSLGIGEFLVLSSLFLDGLYAAVQERMKSGFQTKALSMMTNINKWASVCLVLLCICSLEVVQFISFLQRQPTVMWKLAALSVCGFCGQFSLLSTVTLFGTLPASIVATIRKFFTVLVSVLFLGNSLVMRQWIATAIIFSGLILDILYGKSETKVK